MTFFLLRAPNRTAKKKPNSKPMKTATPHLFRTHHVTTNAFSCTSYFSQTLQESGFTFLIPGQSQDISTSIFLLTSKRKEKKREYG
jgi:hypothetical protein